jgi:hypothetical protein
MFILLAHNTTGTKDDGTSEYDVEVRINERTIAHFHLVDHVRSEGGAALLRRIADKWDEGV